MLIDEQTFLLLKRAIMKDGWLELPSFGNSMFPLIKQGTICRFTPHSPNNVKKGDILLFYSLNGQLIAHRYYSSKIKNKTREYNFKGDTNLGWDRPIEESRVLGKLEVIYKRTFEIHSDNFIPVLWGGIIMAFPQVSGILRRYLNHRIKLQFY
ncbi:hypothetical protein [Neobacillus terrae]|uniref:hypothetical protein n=1 Tax=Neobacillus terrae TaxID=3034837 RepID=UPI00140DAAD4|nr:hypothetical protein [Neobacillus terrae]NHM29292.1 hypothetical protein [Neobacillus terrae]